MEDKKDKNQQGEKQDAVSSAKPQREQHSSAFRETRDQEEKSTINQEEANLEQERKDAERAARRARRHMEQREHSATAESANTEEQKPASLRR